MKRVLLVIAAVGLAAVPGAAQATETAADGQIKVGTDKCHVVVNPPVNVGTEPPYVTWEQTELAPFWVYCPIV